MILWCVADFTLKQWQWTGSPCIEDFIHYHQHCDETHSPKSVKDHADCNEPISLFTSPITTTPFLHPDWTEITL